MTKKPGSEPPEASGGDSAKKEKIIGAEKKQHGLFKKKRGGVVLSKDEVKAIKAGRKKLRRDMRAKGIKSKKEFELTASSLGLYFDKQRFLALLWWFFGKWWPALLLGSAVALVSTLLVFAYVTQLRGHFTISMSDKMFREGFVLSEDVVFTNPTSHLFSTPAENVPCISIIDIPEDIDDAEGEHNSEYFFAYTFFVRNEGDLAGNYRWSLQLNSESKNLSDAAWFMIFEDEEMVFYAKKNENGREMLPPKDGNSNMAYLRAPLYDKAKFPDEQYEVIHKSGELSYWRIMPFEFESDDTIASGIQEQVEPMEIHKYTVVIWLEGDDPDCTNDLIGGNLGLEVYLEYLE